MLYHFDSDTIGLQNVLVVSSFTLSDSPKFGTRQTGGSDSVQGVRLISMSWTPSVLPNGTG